MAGVRLPFGTPQVNSSPLRNAYGAAVDENAANYDDIYNSYDSLQKRAKNASSGGYTAINPVMSNYSPKYSYNRSGDLNSTITDLQNFSKTGGYSDSDLGNIRERSVSPIRSIYSNAGENLRRKQALQGGRSSNYGALTAKMARDSSSAIGDISSKVNANIAEMVQSGKLRSLESLSPLVTADNSARNAIDARNEDARRETEASNNEELRRVDELNKQLSMNYGQKNTDNELNAIQGKQSLYGTNPALTQTFASQVLANNQQNLQAAQTANLIKNQRTSQGVNLLSLMGGGRVKG